MPVWNFILNNVCFSMDGVSVSWLFVAGIFALMWFKRVLVSKKPRK